MQIQNKSLSAAIVSLGAFLWATDTLFRSALAHQYSPVMIVFCTHLVSLFFTAPLVVLGWKNVVKFSAKVWLAMLVVVVGSSVLAMVFFTKAFALTDNYNVPILIQKLQPLVTIGLSAFVLKEKLSKWYWFWALLALAGAYLVSFGNVLVFTSVSSSSLEPILFAGAAGTIWAASTVVSRFMLKDNPYWVVTAVRYVLAFFVLLVWVTATGEVANTQQAFIQDAKVILPMALVPGLLGLIVYYLGLQGTEASVATICELSFPLGAIALNWIWLDSTLSNWQIAGTVVLLFAITMVSLEHQIKKSKLSVGAKV